MAHQTNIKKGGVRMRSVYVCWVISALVLILAAAWSGLLSKKNFLGILVDSRGRFSLSHLQIVLWTILVFSLLSGVFFARLFNGVENPLNIQIPDELLILMGISLGSSTTAGAIKASKDGNEKVHILKETPRRFSQVYLVEEGKPDEEDHVVDIGKFQNLWLTLIVIVAYICAACSYIAAKSTLAELNALPGLSGTLLTLLGISHAGYIGGKIPTRV
jgi:NADH:ubiquinone oxidoreductase subunit 5 (subunit L)/multisubunit Na+/H+ antiporter MnhA subunit